MIESEEKGRLGVEWYYTGGQRLDANPQPLSLDERARRHHRHHGRAVVRRFRVFLNGENLTGVRQTRWDPLVRPTRAADGRWAVDVWAPLEGRNISGGVRLVF